MSGVCSVKPGARALLVADVFRRFLEARREFNLALERCSLKGWPDRKAAIHNATHLQKVFFERLSVRLKDLVLRSGLDDISWNEYTTTRKVHERLQDGWTDDEEQALRLCDKAYARMEGEIAKLQTTADPPALDGPFTMAQRDPDLVSAGIKLESTVRALDRELALESS